MISWNGTTKHPRNENISGVFWAGFKQIQVLSNINPDERKLCTGYKFWLCNVIYNSVLENPSKNK